MFNAIVKTYLEQMNRLIGKQTFRCDFFFATFLCSFFFSFFFYKLQKTTLLSKHNENDEMLFVFLRLYKFWSSVVVVNFAVPVIYFLIQSPIFDYFLFFNFSLSFDFVVV